MWDDDECTYFYSGDNVRKQPETNMQRITSFSNADINGPFNIDNNKSTPKIAMESNVQDSGAHNLNSLGLSQNRSGILVENKLQVKAAPRKVHCTMHDFIYFDPWVWKMIDTPVFQRLRNLKQLGFCSFVFPSANHTRLEHSMGVAY